MELGGVCRVTEVRAHLKMSLIQPPATAGSVQNPLDGGDLRPSAGESHVLSPTVRVSPWDPRGKGTSAFRGCGPCARTPIPGVIILSDRIMELFWLAKTLKMFQSTCPPSSAESPLNQVPQHHLDMWKREN